MNFHKEGCVPHREFPGGPPSKYYLGPTMLNFSDLTRTGGAIVVWWYMHVLRELINKTCRPLTTVKDIGQGLGLVLVIVIEFQFKFGLAIGLG